MVPPQSLTADGTAARPLHLRRRLTFILLGLGAWGTFRLMLAFPGLAEVVAGSGPLPLLSLGLSRVAGMVPFSLAEVVVLGVLVRQATGAVGGIREARRGADAWGRTFLRGGLRLGQDVGALVFLFYVLWGFQYARPGLDRYLELGTEGTAGVAELQSLARHAVSAANREYLEIHGAPDMGHPTQAPPVDSLVPFLEEGWSAVRGSFGLPPRLARHHGAPKPWLLTPVLKRTGTAGMYFPFTGEALVLGDLPGVLLGKTLAHEMAHQRGVASESDANVLGFLVARESPHPLTRYAAFVFLQRQLASALAGSCPPCYLEVVEERLPGVQRDLEDLDRYWAAARGPIRDAARRMNHAMLRSHGIPEGTASYRGSTWVFVALARRDGPDALFGEEP